MGCRDNNGISVSTASFRSLIISLRWKNAYFFHPQPLSVSEAKDSAAGLLMKASFCIASNGPTWHTGSCWYSVLTDQAMKFSLRLTKGICFILELF
jgi:hypothetical protein